MAKSNFKKMTSIKDTEGGNFGHYDEHKGGGTPRGGVWGGKNGRVGWDEREKSGELPQNAHREDQPRTNDGKFTYNGVNGKETKYESRGETVNPLLTGGENGVKIEDAKKEFADKQGSIYDKYKGKWYQKGSKAVSKEGSKYKVKIAANDIWEIARASFDLKTGGFLSEDQAFSETKAGRHSKEEKTAIQEAKKAKAAQFVKSGTGGIAQVANAQPGTKVQTGAQFTINPAVIANFRKKQQILAGAGLATTPSAFNGNGATQLKAGQKQTFSINPAVLANLGIAVNQHTANPVPIQQTQKPKVSLGGFFKKNP